MDIIYIGKQDEQAAHTSTHTSSTGNTQQAGQTTGHTSNTKAGQQSGAEDDNQTKGKFLYKVSFSVLDIIYMEGRKTMTRKIRWKKVGTGNFNNRIGENQGAENPRTFSLPY